MKVITIGRGKDDDVFIDDAYASRHHLQIVLHDDNSFSLVDFGSTNGTFVNGKKVSGEIALNEMDIVRIGNTTIPWRMYFEEADSGTRHTPTILDSAARTFVCPEDRDTSNQGSETTIVNSTPLESKTGPIDVIQTNDTIKSRHGFVSFWLWLIIIGNVIGFIRNFSAILDGYTMSWTIIAPFINVINVICAALLLSWHKLGFVLFIATSIISLLINLMPSLLYGLSLSSVAIGVLSAIVAPIILWAVLQIKKDGVKAWSHLH